MPVPLQSGSSWKLVLVPIYLLFPLYLLPWSMQAADQALGPLDLLFSYSPQFAYEHLQSFGPEGRVAYARTSLYIDTAYPLVYSALFIVLLIQLFKLNDWAHAPGAWLSFTPLLILGFDFAENASILFMLEAFPGRHDSVAGLASRFTSLKWLCVGGVLLLATALAVRAGWKRTVKTG